MGVLLRKWHSVTHGDWLLHNIALQLWKCSELSLSWNYRCLELGRPESPNTPPRLQAEICRSKWLPAPGPKMTSGSAKQRMVFEGDTSLLFPSLLVLILLLGTHVGGYYSHFYYLHGAHQGWKIKTTALPEDPSWAFSVFIPQPLSFCLFAVWAQTETQGLRVCNPTRLLIAQPLVWHRKGWLWIFKMCQCDLSEQTAQTIPGRVRGGWASPSRLPPPAAQEVSFELLVWWVRWGLGWKI